MANKEGYVQNIQLGSHIDDSSNAIEVIKRANKERAHGYWDMNDRDKVQYFVDDLSGKEIKEVRTNFSDELNRLSDMARAIRNAQRALQLALDEPVTEVDDTFDPID